MKMAASSSRLVHSDAIDVFSSAIRAPGPPRIKDAGAPWSRQRKAAVAASSAALVFAVCFFDISTWIVEIDSDGKIVKCVRRRLAKRSVRAAA
jgi:hypothetical protein